MVNFVGDAAGKSGIQTVDLHAGSFGNNKIEVQMPEAIAAKPLTHIWVAGGQPAGMAGNTNVLCVTSANSSVIKANGSINGSDARINAVVAGDGTVDTPAGAVQPIQFSNIDALYLHGSTNSDLLVSNSNTFSVLDGRGGGDWMLAGTGQSVLYGGGAPVGAAVYLFGRATGSGFLLPNTSLDAPTDNTLPGKAFIDGRSGDYDAVASDANIKAVPGRIFTSDGTLDVISWLRASFERAPTRVLRMALDLVNLFPRC